MNEESDSEVSSGGEDIENSLNKRKSFFGILKDYLDEAWFLKFILKIQLCHPSSACNFVCVYLMLVPSYLLIIFVIGLPMLTWYPRVVEVGDSYDRFSEDRVRELVKEFTKNGSRQVYSRQNIHSSNWLVEQTNEILEEGEFWVQSSVELQEFSLVSTTGIPESQPLFNLLVEVTSSKILSNNSLLFMAHFDSMFNTPGVSDNACGVSVLFELMRVLTNLNEEVLFPVLFYFVNSEENGLYGSSSISNFRRFEDIKRFVNVDNLGGKGRFQMTKVEPSVLAKEVGSISEIQGDQMTLTMMNFFPQSTDFESLRKLGIPGFEFTQTRMTFEHHTDNDRDESKITEGSIQMLGNALERFYDVYVYDEDSPLLENPEAESDLDYVFYNFFGLNYSVYASKTSLVFSILMFFLCTFIMVSVFLGLDYNQILIKPGNRYYEESPLVDKEEKVGFWPHMFKKVVILTVYCFGYILSFLFASGVSMVVGLLLSANNVMSYQRNFTLTTITLCLASLLGLLIPQYFVHLFLHYCFQIHHYVDVHDRYVSLYILISVIVVIFEVFEMPMPSLWFYIFNYLLALIFCLINFLLQKLLLGISDPKKIRKKLLKRRSKKLKLASIPFDDSEKEITDDEEKGTNMEHFLDDMTPSVGLVQDFDRGLSELVPSVGYDRISKAFDSEEEYGEKKSFTSATTTSVDEAYDREEEERKQDVERKGDVFTSSESEEDGQTTSGGATEEEDQNIAGSDESDLEEGGNAVLESYDSAEEGKSSQTENSSSFDASGEKYSEDTRNEERKKTSADGTKYFEFAYGVLYIIVRREKCCFMFLPYLLLVVGVFHMTNCWVLMSQTFPAFGKDEYVLPAVIYSFVVSFFTVSVFTCILPWFLRAANFCRVFIVMGIILLVFTIVTLSQFPYSTSQPKRVTVTIETESSQTIDVSSFSSYPYEHDDVDAEEAEVGTGLIYSWDSDTIDEDHGVFDYYFDNTPYTKSDISCSDGVCRFPIQNTDTDMKGMKIFRVTKTSSSDFELYMSYDPTAYLLISVSSRNAVLSSFSDSRVVTDDSGFDYYYVNVISEQLSFEVELLEGDSVDLEIRLHFCDDDSKPDFISQMFEMEDWMTLVGAKCLDYRNDDDVEYSREECRSCDFLKVSYDLEVILEN